ncbi:MAG: ABC transporter permease [Desulfobacterales bacterium]|nr:MAG: ABC transporter permease [Desulfobacterales bacterium]
MLARRVYQFFIIYFLGIAILFLIKYVLNLSDYVIPSPLEIWQTAQNVFGRFVFNVIDTISIAILGHLLSICLATIVGIIGRLTLWIGSFIRVAAYNIQAYPIVAVAPIIFILLGDGLSSRLLITAMICYFPLLLSFIGILSEPVTAIEHFYESTLRMNWRLQVKIRAFENVGKITTVIVGSGTLAIVGTIVSEFIAANAGIGHSIRIALYQSDLAKILVALFLIGICTSIYLVCLEWLGLVVQRRLQGT